MYIKTRLFSTVKIRRFPAFSRIISITRENEAHPYENESFINDYIPPSFFGKRGSRPPRKVGRAFSLVYAKTARKFTIKSHSLRYIITRMYVYKSTRRMIKGNSRVPTSVGGMETV